MDFSIIPQTFERGLDTKTDPRILRGPWCLKLENLRYDTEGAWRVRNGLTTINSLGSGTALYSFNKELIATTLSDFKAYSGSLGIFTSRGPYDPWGITAFQVSPGPSAQSNPSVAVYTINNSDIVLTVWQDKKSNANSTIQGKVTDANGTLLSQQFQVDGNSGIDYTNPHAFAMSDRFVILYQNSLGHILFSYILFNDPTYTLYGPINLDFGTALAACYIQETDHLLIGYKDGSNNPRGGYCSKTGYLTFISNFTTDVGANISRIYVNYRMNNGHPENLFLYVYSGQIKATTTNYQMHPVVSPTVIDFSSPNLDKPVGHFNQSVWRLYWIDNGGPTIGIPEGANTVIKTGTLSTTGTVDAYYFYLRNRTIVGGSIQIGSSTYLPVYSYGDYPSYEFLVGETSPRLIARTGYASVPKSSDGSVFFPVYTNGRYYFPQQSTANNFYDSNFNPQPDIQNYVLSNTATATTADSLSLELYIGGPHIYSYDGTKAYENGLPIPDKAVSVVGQAGSNTYLYCHTYSFVTARGTLYESTPSAIYTAANVASPDQQSLTYTIRTLKLTDKGGIKINIYRSTNGGTSFFLVGQVDNSTVVDTVSFVDTVSDAILQTRATLYTTGNVLSNDPPPKGTILRSLNQRLFIAGNPEYPYRLYYSKIGAPYAFPSTFYIDIRPEDTGENAITGLGYIDKYLLIFKKNSIYLLSGVGPDDTGQNSDFDLQKLPIDIGCADPRSVVTAAHRCFFKSTKGIYAINRSFREEYIGKEVEAYNSYGVVSAMVYPENNEVRFATSDQYVLVYNYYNELKLTNPSPGVWSVFTNQNAVGIALLNNTYYVLTPDGYIKEENKTGTINDFNDDKRPIVVRARSPWLFIDQPQSLKRYRRAGIIGAYSPKVLVTLGAHYNYVEGFDELRTYSLGESSTYDSGLYNSGPYGGAGGEVNLRYLFTKQLAHAVSLEVFAQCRNQDFIISGVALEAGLRRGLKQGISA